ncbi:MAG TPA: hypothetical protein VM537_25720 [Anaerolineae bacterium]|nr:hypothetical protein [Anaerolineae bacterium]
MQVHAQALDEEGGLLQQRLSRVAGEGLQQQNDLQVVRALVGLDRVPIEQRPTDITKL